MAAAPSRKGHTRRAWALALARRRAASRTIALTTDDCLNESARHLDRTYQRLDESARRIGRIKRAPAV